MKIIRLNGKQMNTVEKVHEMIKNKLAFPDYYGNNLDALWDMLSTESEDLHIILLHKEELQKQLGQYADQILEVFRDAAAENEHIRFDWMR